MSTNPVFQIQNPNSPLTQQHFEAIKAALDVLDNAQQQAELAQRAGIDVQAQMDTIKQQRAQLLQIKNTYFPGQ
jgi:hypothetical protein